ncbi:MAG: KOW motif-containing protein [Candidatus Pacearchaeota archaeon]|nr:KOW motif-containing protein [Candidatus Pacearchaeota archaeon]
MHLKRNNASRKLPVPRKGTKYLARALNNHKSGVPVVVAVRDMLGIARDAREVKKMAYGKLLKINGRAVKDIRESIKLFGILQADKTYMLKILPSGRFFFEETKGGTRICKVIGRKVLTGNSVQVNLHDGTNFISKEDIVIGGSVELDMENKMNKFISLEKGKNVFVVSGKSVGLTGRVEKIDEKNVLVKFDNEKMEVMLNKSHLIVL